MNARDDDTALKVREISRAVVSNLLIGMGSTMFTRGTTMMATVLSLSVPLTSWADESGAKEGGGGGSTQDERITALEKKAGDLEKDVKKLKTLKFSGYVQARYTQDQSSTPGIKNDGKTPGNKDGFALRRSRMRVMNKTDQTEATLQFELTPAGVLMKDASVTFLEPWTQLKGGLIAGQYSVPFGYEVPRSPAKNEFMERSQMWSRLFPNEVDRGVGLVGSYKGLNFNVGVVNGNGAVDTATRVFVPSDVDGDGTIAEGEVKQLGTVDFTSRSADRDDKKDLYLRLGYGSDKDAVSGAINVYQGSWGQVPVLVDEDGDGKYDNGDQVVYLPKTRYGADFQLHKAFVESLGLTEFRLEYVQGHGWFSADIESDTDFRGYDVALLQGLGKFVTLGVRYDVWDPDLSKVEDELTGIEPILLFPIATSGRITTSYRVIKDHDGTDGADKANNVLQLQFQGYF